MYFKSFNLNALQVETFEIHILKLIKLIWAHATQNFRSADVSSAAFAALDTLQFWLWFTSRSMVLHNGQSNSTRGEIDLKSNSKLGCTKVFRTANTEINTPICRKFCAACAHISFSAWVCIFQKFHLGWSWNTCQTVPLRTSAHNLKSSISTPSLEMFW